MKDTPVQPLHLDRFEDPFFREAARPQRLARQVWSRGLGGEW
jgi:hypothetical protein